MGKNCELCNNNAVIMSFVRSTQHFCVCFLVIWINGKFSEISHRFMRKRSIRSAQLCDKKKCSKIKVLRMKMVNKNINSMIFDTEMTLTQSPAFFFFFYLSQRTHGHSSRYVA